MTSKSNKPHRGRNSKYDSDEDVSSDDDSDDDEPLDFRRRDCVGSIKATGIAALLVPAVRQDLLFFLLDEITTLKRKKAATLSETPADNTRRTTRERLLATSLYYEPTLAQFIHTLDPTNKATTPTSSSSFASRPGTGNTSTGNTTHPHPHAGGPGRTATAATTDAPHNTKNSAIVKYLLHRLKVALSSPDALDDLLLSFQELLGDPRLSNADKGDTDDDEEEEEDPAALSEEDDSANALSPGSVPGGMPRYVERKSVLGLFLRRVCLMSSRMVRWQRVATTCGNVVVSVRGGQCFFCISQCFFIIISDGRFFCCCCCVVVLLCCFFWFLFWAPQLFDGLSMLYDTMLQYNQKGMYDKMTTTIFGTQATPQKPNKTTTRTTTTSSSSSSSSNVPRVPTFFSGSTHDNNDDDGALPKVRTKNQAMQSELWYYDWCTVDTR
jgi:hypothetical protein